MRAIASGKNRQFLSQGLGRDWYASGPAGHFDRFAHSMPSAVAKVLQIKKEEPKKVMYPREDSLWNRRTMGDGEDMEPDPEWIVSIEDADNVLDAFRAGVFRGGHVLGGSYGEEE